MGYGMMPGAYPRYGWGRGPCGGGMAWGRGGGFGRGMGRGRWW
jgi:hypothetical protein